MFIKRGNILYTRFQRKSCDILCSYKNAPSETENNNAELLLDHDVTTGYKNYNILLKGKKAVSSAKF